MAETNFAPTEPNRTDARIGLLLEDQRTKDLRRVVYVDSRVVLLRDESNHTTLQSRASFESNLGTRYRPSAASGDSIDGGQYDRLRDRLAEYEAADGRKADHKTAALREALDLVGERAGTDPGTETDIDADGSDDDAGESAAEDEAVAFEEIPGIGPETAGELRINGFVTEADVRSADDEEVLAVSGIGPSNLANIRDSLG